MSKDLIQNGSMTLIAFISAWAIDIVLIALGWQAIFAKSMKIELTWTQQLILALSIWLVYMGDRWLDVKKMPIDTIVSKRRLIIKNLHVPIRYLFAVVLLINLLMAFLYLKQLQFILGITILLGSILYVKFVSRSRVFPIPKEIIVSILFALGIFLFLVDHETAINQHFWISLFLLILLLTTNAILIAFWEINLDIAEEQPSFATRNQIRYDWSIVLAISIGIISFFYFYIVFLNNLSLALSFLAAGLGLGGLAFLKNKVAPETLHFLADLSLLGPWLFIF